METLLAVAILCLSTPVTLFGIAITFCIASDDYSETIEMVSAILITLCGVAATTLSILSLCLG
jgi:hypothetical protein